jgi:hypothetical protein
MAPQLQPRISTSLTDVTSTYSGIDARKGVALAILLSAWKQPALYRCKCSKAVRPPLATEIAGRNPSVERGKHASQLLVYRVRVISRFPKASC